MGYVYKYVFKQEIIYIGKTNCLDNRLKAHGGKGDNIDEQYWGEINSSDIYIKTIDGDLATDLVETLLINKYKPKCNKAKLINGYENLCINIDGADEGWERYEPERFHLSYGYVTPAQYKALRQELNIKHMQYEELRQELNAKQKQYSELLKKYSELKAENANLQNKVDQVWRAEKECKTQKLDNGVPDEIIVEVNRMLNKTEVKMLGETPDSYADIWLLEGKKNAFRAIASALMHIIGFSYQFKMTYRTEVC